jgi:hypothetical protein
MDGKDASEIPVGMRRVCRRFERSLACGAVSRLPANTRIAAWNLLASSRVWRAGWIGDLNAAVLRPSLVVIIVRNRLYLAVPLRA